MPKKIASIYMTRKNLFFTGNYELQFVDIHSVSVTPPTVTKPQLSYKLRLYSELN